MSDDHDFVLYRETRPGRFSAYDHRGLACGFVGEESMQNDIAWRDRKGMPYKVDRLEPQQTSMEL